MSPPCLSSGVQYDEDRGREHPQCLNYKLVGALTARLQQLTSQCVSVILLHSLINFLIFSFFLLVFQLFIPEFLSLLISFHHFLILLILQWYFSGEPARRENLQISACF